jgi:hypothetical protein
MQLNQFIATHASFYAQVTNQKTKPRLTVRLRFYGKPSQASSLADFHREFLRCGNFWTTDSRCGIEVVRLHDLSRLSTRVGLRSVPAVVGHGLHPRTPVVQSWLECCRLMPKAARRDAHRRGIGYRPSEQVPRWLAAVEIHAERRQRYPMVPWPDTLPEIVV